MPQRDLNSLARRIETLMESHSHLMVEYNLLLERQATWEAERRKLIEQNRLLSLKVERLARNAKGGE